MENRYIEIKDLKFSYANAGVKETILDGVNLGIDAGDFVCLLGQSGSGKSTLLRLLAGLEKAEEGNIKIDDQLVEGAGLDRAVVFQDYGLYPWK